MDGPLKERTRTKLAKATMITPASIHINKTNIKIFVDCNRFNKGEIHEVRIECMDP